MKNIGVMAKSILVKKCKQMKHITMYIFYCVRCGGLVVSVPATRSARPGFESRPGPLPKSGLRGGTFLCKYCTN